MARFWLAALLVTASATAATAQTAAPAPAAPVTAQLFPTPRVRIGKAFSIELITKLQVDVSRFDPVVDDDDGDLDWRRRRLGVKGELFNRISFEVERELGDDDDPWRDVFVNVKAADTLEVKAGHFRVPFSLDGLTGSTSHDFVNRSLGGSGIAPGRDLGVMVHGRTDGRVLTYALGVFDSDDAVDEVGAFFDDEKGAASLGRTVGGRVTVQPFDRVDRLPRGLRNLEFGGNATWSSVPEGLNGFEGRSVYRYTFFEPVYVKGDRVRAGVDALFRAGPTSVKAEWMRMWDERRAQGLGDVDLPKALSRAWYVAGTWLVTGETKDENVRPRGRFCGAASAPSKRRCGSNGWAWAACPRAVSRPSPIRARPTCSAITTTSSLWASRGTSTAGSGCRATPSTSRSTTSSARRSPAGPPTGVTWAACSSSCNAA